MNEWAPVAVLTAHDRCRGDPIPIVERTRNVIRGGSVDHLSVDSHPGRTRNKPVVTGFVADTARKMALEALRRHRLAKIVRKLDDAAQWPERRILVVRRIIDA